MDEHFAPLKRGEWVTFGNTLYLSDAPGDFIVFPGDAGTAQRLRDAHNAALDRIRRVLTPHLSQEEFETFLAETEKHTKE